MRRKKYTDEQLIEAIKNNFSIRGVLLSLGLAEAGGSYKLFHKRVKDLGLDTSHFTGQAHLKGKVNLWSKKISLEEILVKNSNYLSSSHLRKRLIKEGYFINKCSRCDISQWQGEDLSLHLDHIDGDNTNNELSNLRLLCPNCHSLTETYCGKNKKVHQEKTIYNCQNCSKTLKCYRKSGLCIDCSISFKKITKQLYKKEKKPRPTKIIWPSIEVLISMVKEKGYLQVGRELGISDNAIRKRIKTRNDR